MNAGSKVFSGIVVFLIIAGFIYLLYVQERNNAPREEAYTELAQCLSESNETIFYGAYWCPQCAAQKSHFGDAADMLPYTECSSPDGSSQLEVCGQEGVQSYPTWDFQGGIRCRGTIPPEILATLSNCPLPSYEGNEYVDVNWYERLVGSVLRERFVEAGVLSEEEIEEELRIIKEEIENVASTEIGVSLYELDDREAIEFLAMAVYCDLHVSDLDEGDGASEEAPADA